MQGERFKEINSPKLLSVRAQFKFLNHGPVCLYLVFRCSFPGSCPQVPACTEEFATRNLWADLPRKQYNQLHSVSSLELHLSSYIPPAQGQNSHQYAKSMQNSPRLSFLLKTHAQLQIKVSLQFLFSTVRQLSFKTAFNSGFPVIIKYPTNTHDKGNVQLWDGLCTKLLVFESKDSNAFTHDKCSIKVESYM